MSAQLDTECTPERLILDLRTLGFEELPAIGRYRYCSSHLPLATESHDGLIEVHILEKGEQVFYLGEESYILRGKNVFLTLPGEVHGTGRNPLSKGKLYWFFIEPPKGRSFLGFDAEETELICKTLLNPGERLFSNGTKLIKIAESIFTAVRDELPGLAHARIKTYLMGLVLELAFLVDRPNSSSPPRAPSAAISATLAHITENIGERLRLEDMAAVAGLSVPRFKVRFKEEVGFTPNAYLNHLRICSAKKALVSEREKVTAIAQDLGYPSSQYFSKVFRKFTGLTPTQYRNDPTD